MNMVGVAARVASQLAAVHLWGKSKYRVYTIYVYVYVCIYRVNPRGTVAHLGNQG